MSRVSKARSRRQMGKASKPGVVRKAMHNRQALLCGLTMHKPRTEDLCVDVTGVPTIGDDLHTIFKAKGDNAVLTETQDAQYIAQVEAARDELRRRKLEKKLATNPHE